MVFLGWFLLGVLIIATLGGMLPALIQIVITLVMNPIAIVILLIVGVFAAFMSR